jgi:hypothetical protein
MIINPAQLNTCEGILHKDEEDRQSHERLAKDEVCNRLNEQIKTDKESTMLNTVNQQTIRQIGRRKEQIT